VVAIPKAVLDLVDLRAGSKVEIAIDQGRLIVVPKPRPRYQLAELLALCDPNLPLTAEELEWLNAPAVGLEAGAEASAKES
jgi:antitoxin ChpS